MKGDKKPRPSKRIMQIKGPETNPEDHTFGRFGVREIHKNSNTEAAEKYDSSCIRHQILKVIV